MPLNEEIRGGKGTHSAQRGIVRPKRQTYRSPVELLKRGDKGVQCVCALFKSGSPIASANYATP